jgi:hypothetical protein
MSLNLNSIGNYNTFSPASKGANLSVSEKKATQNSENVSGAEKKFFAEMYPSNKNEIMRYSFYERNGRMNGISIGANLDRRG